MRFTTIFVSLALAVSPLAVRAEVFGIDVSDYQPDVDFETIKANGVEFVYIKATEGTTFVADTFSSKYTAATNAGLIRGAYHYARPANSKGVDEANWFLSNGGSWTNDGITLPGAIDLEVDCPLGAADLIAWIKEFSTTYAEATGRPPVIYTLTSWWTECTGNSAEIGDTVTENPLWIARWSDAPGELPAGWGSASFWQFSDGGDLGPGDQDQWLGDSDSLKKFATGA